MTGSTLVEKVIARAAGRLRVTPGEIVTVKIDFAFAHDSSGPRRWAPLLAEMGADLHDPATVAIVSDHYVPAVDAESAAILKLTRDFARAHSVGDFIDMEGICHVVLPERGLVRPGALIAGGDSHTTTAGAFGAYAAGFGATDMAAIVATGETWLSVPRTIRVDLHGVLPAGVTAKDIMLRLCRALGMDNAFQAVEYGGEAVEAMSMDQRMVLSNMAAELGCEAGVIAPDRTTLAYLAACGKPAENVNETLALASDADAVFAIRYDLDVSTLAPQIAAPHAPSNSGDIARYEGVAVDQAYIGACVGAKLEDLRMAAEVLRGHRVADGTRLLVAPASSRILKAASDEGLLAVLLNAGAVMLPSGCGACAGMGAGLLAAGEVCLSTTNRNFKGRMGHADSLVYLGSPYAVAAAAVTGVITDPRPLLSRAAVSASVAA